MHIVIQSYLLGVGANRVGVSGEYGYGTTNTPIHLSNLQCTGNESEINLCVADEEPTVCTHIHDVSVECLRKYNYLGVALLWLV